MYSASPHYHTKPPQYYQPVIRALKCSYGIYMYYLIYVSSAVDLMSDTELLSLQKQSIEKNSQLDITGMLLYKSGNFMQYLEGKEDDVLALYEAIKRDSRHKHIITIQTGTQTQRSYRDWSMGFINMNKIDDLPPFHDYIRDNLTLKEFGDDAKTAYKFMCLFHDKNR